MKSPLCSLIIVTHNRCDLLPKAINSAMNQSLSNIEIIIIDDNSVDNTALLVQGFIKEDNRILYYKNEKNISLGESRNKGINLAKGQYIAFCDDDDWLSLDYLEKLYHSSKSNDADVVKCPSIFYESEIHQLTVFKHEVKNYTTLNEKLSLLWNGSINGLFKKDFLIKNTIFFTNDIYYEDVLFIIKAYEFANKVSYIDNAYYYINRSNVLAITREISPNILAKKLQSVLLLLQYFNNEYEQKEFILNNPNVIATLEHTLNNEVVKQIDNYVQQYKFIKHSTLEIGNKKIKRFDFFSIEKQKSNNRHFSYHKSVTIKLFNFVLLSRKKQKDNIAKIYCNELILFKGLIFCSKVEKSSKSIKLFGINLVKKAY